MTNLSRAIEIGAKALREHDMAGRVTVEWDRIPNGQKKKWRKKAEAALSALAAEGFVVVPKEPSIAQHIAAMEFALGHMKAYGVDGLSPFKDYPPLRETTAGMYRAMISAASQEER